MRMASKGVEETGFGTLARTVLNRRKTPMNTPNARPVLFNQSMMISCPFSNSPKMKRVFLNLDREQEQIFLISVLNMKNFLAAGPLLASCHFWKFWIEELERQNQVGPRDAPQKWSVSILITLKSKILFSGKSTKRKR